MQREDIRWELNLDSCPEKGQTRRDRHWAAELACKRIAAGNVQRAVKKWRTKAGKQTLNICKYVQAQPLLGATWQRVAALHGALPLALRESCGNLAAHVKLKLLPEVEVAGTFCACVVSFLQRWWRCSTECGDTLLCCTAVLPCSGLSDPWPQGLL